MSKLKIISVGEVLWDLFPDGEQFGGAPANFACHASLQGADVLMLSAVGDDQRGRDAVNILSGYDIDVSMMQIVSDAPTGTVGVEVDSNGKPAYVIHEGSAWDQLAWHDEIASRLMEADAVCFGTLGQRNSIARQTIRRAIETAAAAGVARVVDINLRQPFIDRETIRASIQLASILKLSDEELGEVCSACDVSASENHEAMRRLLEFGGLDMIVMTRGADGAVLVTADTVIEQQGIPATVVDTVGAGDSLTAAFLIEELLGHPHEESLRKACEVAAMACSPAGAVPLRITQQSDSTEGVAPWIIRSRIGQQRKTMMD